MKRLALAILAIVTTATAGYSASLTLPFPTYHSGYVYLGDAPTTPLRDRIPTGNVASVNSGIFDPQGDITFRGGDLRVETNKNLTLIYKPDVSAMQTSIVVNANGYITLQKWVTGEGNYAYTLDPENPPVSTTSGVAYAQGALFTGDVAMTNDATLYVGTNGIYLYNGVANSAVLYYDAATDARILDVGSSIVGDITTASGIIYYSDVSAIGLEERKLFDNNGISALEWAAGSGGIVIGTNIVMQGHAITNGIYYGDGAGVTNAPYISNDKNNAVGVEITFQESIVMGAMGTPATPGFKIARYASGDYDYMTLTNRTLEYTGPGGVIADLFTGNGAGLTNVQSVAGSPRCAAYLVSPGYTTTVTAAGTYQWLEGSFSNQCASGFTASASNIIYIGTSTKDFEIDWHTSVSANALNTEVYVALAHNGTVSEMSKQVSETKDANIISSFGGTCILTLSSNDTVQIQTTSDGSSDELYYRTFVTSIREFN